MENPIIVGCNYHTTWQSSKQMRFVLVEIYKDRVRLITRVSGKDFWTNKSDLIFIRTKYNINKAKELGYEKLENI